jgi:hypothetical protein
MVIGISLGCLALGARLLLAPRIAAVAADREHMSVRHVGDRADVAGAGRV